MFGFLFLVLCCCFVRFVSCLFNVYCWSNIAPILAPNLPYLFWLKPCWDTRALHRRNFGSSLVGILAQAFLGHENPSPKPFWLKPCWDTLPAVRKERVCYRQGPGPAKQAGRAKPLRNICANSAAWLGTARTIGCQVLQPGPRGHPGS